MKALFVDAALEYVNPTRQLVPGLFRAAFDTTFFGPGYVDAKVLDRGLEAFLEERGPFALLAATEIVFSAAFSDSRDEDVAAAIRRLYVSDFDAEQAARSLREAFAVLESRREPLLLCHFAFDYYNMRQSHLDLLERTGARVVGWGREFVAPVEELTTLGRERFATSANDRWCRFAERHPERVVSLPAAVFEHEFAWGPLSERRRAWSVVGSSYEARRVVRRRLAEEGLRWSGRSLHSAASVFQRVGLAPHRSRLGIALLNHGFRRAIASARYGYTCGSGLRFPVRKFFEIPALGAVLVAQPCNGYAALGFRDRWNAIACAPEDVMDVHRFLEGDGDRAQRIATAGRDLVWRAHTLRARARQLEEAAGAIVAGRYGGSRWSEGRFELVPESAAGA